MKRMLTGVLFGGVLLVGGAGRVNAEESGPTPARTTIFRYCTLCAVGWQTCNCTILDPIIINPS